MPLADAVRGRLGFDMDYENSLGFYDRAVLVPRTADTERQARAGQALQPASMWIVCPMMQLAPARGENHPARV